MPDRISVTAHEFVRNAGYWQNEALHRIVSIMHHGREQLVLARPGEERARRDEAEALRAAIAINPRLANFSLDRDGRIDGVDRSLCTTLGVEAADLQGRRLDELVEPERRAEVSSAVTRVLVGLEAMAFAVVLMGHNGRAIAGELSLTPILTDAMARGVQGLWVLDLLI